MKIVFFNDNNTVLDIINSDTLSVTTNGERFDFTYDDGGKSMGVNPERVLILPDETEVGEAVTPELVAQATPITDFILPTDAERIRAIEMATLAMMLGGGVNV